MIVFTLTSLSGTGLRSTARRAMLDPSQCTSRQGKFGTRHTNTLLSKFTIHLLEKCQKARNTLKFA
jgi:hypothetical protein